MTECGRRRSTIGSDLPSPVTLCLLQRKVSQNNFGIVGNGEFGPKTSVIIMLR